MSNKRKDEEARNNAQKRISETKQFLVAAHGETILIATQSDAKDYIEMDRKSTRRWLFMMENPELLSIVYKTNPLLHQLHFHKMKAKSISHEELLRHMLTEECTAAYYLDKNAVGHVFSLSELMCMIHGQDIQDAIHLNLCPGDIDILSLSEAHKFNETNAAVSVMVQELAKANIVDYLGRRDDGMPAMSPFDGKASLICRFGTSAAAETMPQKVAELHDTSVDLWEWVTVTVEQLAQIVIETKGVLGGAYVIFSENVGTYDADDLLEAAAQRKLWYNSVIQGNDLDEEALNVQSEMQEICEWLWQSDALNLWNKNELVSLAYTLDRMCQTMTKIEYYDKLIEWRNFAKMGQWQNLALSISFTTMQMLSLDTMVVLSDNEKTAIMEKYEQIRSSTNSSNDTIFGIVPYRCAPNWCHETVNQILEDQKDLLRERFSSAAKSYGLSDDQTELIYNSMHQISQELLLEMDWVLRFQKFKRGNPITIYDHKRERIMRAEDYYQEIDGHKTIVGAYLSMLLTINDNIISRNNRSNN